MKIHPCGADEIGHRTALVAVGSRIVGFYLAPLPDPLRSELHFIGMGGSVPIRADVLIVPPRPDGDEVDEKIAGAYVIRFQTRDDIAQIVARMAAIGGPPLFEMFAVEKGSPDAL
jgi:hypothetical protein